MTDREIDALVAEKVLGQTWDESRCRICGWPIYEFPGEGCTIDDCSLRPLPKTRKDEPAHFTTDAWACALVLDEIERRGWIWAMCLTKRADATHKYLVEIWTPKRYYIVGEDTRYRAVALAALRAVGVEG
jgi:hypothetical protein